MIFYDIRFVDILCIDSVKKGVEKAGAKCTIYKVPETLPTEGKYRIYYMLSIFSRRG